METPSTVGQPIDPRSTGTHAAVLEPQPGRMSTWQAWKNVVWVGGWTKQTGNEERRQRPISVFNFSSFRLFVRMCAAVEQNMALSFFWSIASSSSSSSSITTGVQLILPTKTAELGVRVCPNLCSYLLERALATSLALTWVCKFHLASHTSRLRWRRNQHRLHSSAISAIVGALFRGRTLQTHVARDVHCLASSSIYLFFRWRTRANR